VGTEAALEDERLAFLVRIEHVLALGAEFDALEVDHGV
jgi:hypothetical protein